LCGISLIGREYQSFDGQRRWELLFEGVLLVLLDTGVERGSDHNFVGIGISDLRVRWVVGGVIDSADQYDGIVNVWVIGGQLWASTWSGSSLRIDHQSGAVVERVFSR